MTPLAKVTDGADASALMREGAFNFFLAAPWIALWFGVHVTGGGWFAVVLTGTLLAVGTYLFSRIPDREATPSPGVWLTTRKGWWRRQAAAVAPLGGMLVMLIMAVMAVLRKGPAWEAVYAPCVALVFAVQAVVAARKARAVDDVELRIDDAGLYSRDLGGLLLWDQVLEIRPRLRGDEAVLRLTVGPNALPRLSARQREHGGQVAVDLRDAGVRRDVVIAALTSHRPALDPTARAVKTADSVFVLPIEGVFVEPSVEEQASTLGPVLVGVAIGAAISS